MTTVTTEPHLHIMVILFIPTFWRTTHIYHVLYNCAGEKYLGQWVCDIRSGPGLLVTLDGCYLEGNFVNSKLVVSWVSMN